MIWEEIKIFIETNSNFDHPSNKALMAIGLLVTLDDAVDLA